MTTAAHLIAGASDHVDRVALFLAKTALAGMVVVIGVQVVARYGLHSPPAWTEELARYLMVWGGLLGATASFKRGIDPTVVQRDEAGSDGKARFARIALAAAVIVFLAPILYFSFFGPGGDMGRSFLMRNFARTSAGLGLNLVFIAAAIPTFCIIILIHLASRIAGVRTRGQTPTHAPDIA